MPKARGPDEGLTWLTGLVLGAAHLVRGKPIGTKSISGREEFSILQTNVGETSTYKIHLVSIGEAGRTAIMKVAKGAEYNHLIEAESDALREIRLSALGVDEDRKDERPFNYQLFFPELIESFQSEDGRAVNIVGYPQFIEHSHELIPLSRIIGKGEFLDVKTAVWILGKALKAIDFTQSFSFFNKNLHPSNILIQPDRHGVMIFDWTSYDYAEDDREFAKKASFQVQQIAKVILQVCGYDPDTSELPYVDVLERVQHEEMKEFLLMLTSVSSMDAYEAQQQLYVLSDKIWPKTPVDPTKSDGKMKRQFHLFKTYSL